MRPAKAETGSTYLFHKGMAGSALNDHLPEDFSRFAEQKFKEINESYAAITKGR